MLASSIPEYPGARTLAEKVAWHCATLKEPRENPELNKEVEKKRLHLNGIELLAHEEFNMVDVTLDGTLRGWIDKWTDF